jgi:hypothetical protein
MEQDGPPGARPARESSILIPVPAAEPAVGSWRATHDPVASLGVPAHITLLYPFRAPEPLDWSVLREPASFFAALSPVPFVLARTDTFPGVLYLAPEPAVPFVRLTEGLVARFPDCPPYGGAYPNITPHLTVAKLNEPAGLDEVVAGFSTAAAAALPIATTAAEAWLMESGDDGRWSIRRRFPFLAGADSAGRSGRP